MPRFRDLSLSAKRRVVQFTSLVLLNSSWGPEFKWLCNPVLNCHSCVLAWFACPVGVFVHYSGYQMFPFFALGIVLLLGVLIGRLLCGWVCPFGLVQDLLYKLPGPKFELPRWTANFKYVVLALTVILLPLILGSETLLSFCRICPASALQVTIPNLIMGSGEVDMLMAVKLGFLLLVVVLAIASSRSFCRTFCPIGAILAPLNYISFWKIKTPTQNCLTCRKCDKACPQNGTPSERIQAGVAANRTLDCIVCHECQTICPRPMPKQNKENPAAIDSPGA